MLYIWATLLVLVNTVWLLLVVLGLPGNWLMVLGTALLAWWQWRPDEPWSEQMFHPATLLVIAALALAGEGFEFLLSAAGSRQAGGTRWGAAGSIGGAIVGGVIGTFAIPLPLLGSLIGACAGAFAGALLLEMGGGGKLGFALRSGRGAAVGRFWGTLAKLAIGVTIWLLVAIAAFWP